MKSSFRRALVEDDAGHRGEHEKLRPQGTREVWEETGLYTIPVCLLGVYGGPGCVVTYSIGDRTAYVMAVFECEVRSGALRQVSDETTAAEFVGAGELSEYCTSPWVHHAVPALYDRSRSRHFNAPSWQPPRDDHEHWSKPHHRTLDCL